MSAGVPMYVIYRSPNDYSGFFVTRRVLVSHEIIPDEKPLCVEHDLDDARAAIPAGMVRVERHWTDDAVIVEVWL